MTSQSTDTHMAALEAAKEVRLFRPHLRPGQAYRRRLWLTPDVWEWVQFNQGATSSDRDHRANARVFLKRFVTGEDFDDDAMLKPLLPKTRGLYSFRVLFQPQHRIIGGFLGPGEFVATAQKLRRELETETWVPTLTLARSEWARLFPGISRSTESRKDNLKDFPV